MLIGTASAENAGKSIGHIAIDLADGRRVKIPVGIVRGTEKGPVLYAQAGQHGMELNGVVAIAETLKQLKPDFLNGTFIGVPIANPLALVQRRPHFGLGPEEPYGNRPHLNMNRLWPGNPSGSEAQRLANGLWDQAVVKADCVVDLHSYERWSASCTISSERGDSLDLAKAFGLRFISIGTERVEESKLVVERWMMVTDAAEERGMPAIAAEIAGQWDIYRKSVNEGIRGINNVMKKIGMLSGEPITPPDYVRLGKDPSKKAFMDRDGLLMASADPGDEVVRDQVIAKVMDVLTLDEVDVRSPARGIVYHLGPSGPNRDVRLPDMHPLLEKGAEVAVIYER